MDAHVPPAPEVRRLGAGDLDIVAAIDRSEPVTVEYEVREGQIVERPVSTAHIPSWDPVGTGPHSLAAMLEFCRRVVADGAAFLGAFVNDEPAGVALIDPDYEPALSWLAFLYVSRPHRRRGVASALWEEAVTLTPDAVDGLYVSATPTGSAVGFYLSRGCRLADPVHPTLYATEPDDVHFVCPLQVVRQHFALEDLQVSEIMIKRRLVFVTIDSV